MFMNVKNAGTRMYAMRVIFATEYIYTPENGIDGRSYTIQYQDVDVNTV